MLKHKIFTTSIVIAALQMSNALAAGFTDANAFYDAALCKPAYTSKVAGEVYEAAEKLAKADTSTVMGVALYTLKQQFGRDGFESNQVLFSNSAVGVLINGQRAADLAAKYQLKAGASDMFGTATKEFARELPAKQQPAAGLMGPGKVSIVARESEAFPGKTMLACEFVSDADKQAMEALKKSK